MTDKKEIAIKRKAQTKEAEETDSREYYTPPVDIYETDDGLVLKADMPGVSKDGLDIKVEKDVLTIRGTVGRPPEDADLLYGEYGIGDYYRAFTVSEDIDADKISAEISNGVLTMSLPKAEAARTRKIEVKGA